MGAGEALPGHEPPIRVETVHESERTRVTRLHFPERTLVVKEPLGPDAERRLRHETAMLERLRGLAGVAQAFRTLGRLLLAEPEDELERVRARILAEVGPNAGLLAAVVPEFAALLAVPPEAGDPLTAQLRTPRSAVGVLRAVASRDRPVVLFLDDLQWAGRTPLGLVDLVLSEEPVEGLLLVGAYRHGEAEATHPLAASLSRWREQAGLWRLGLDNLSTPNLGVMVAEMLHVDPATAAGLVEMIEPHTAGNPYETVELLGALRRDGVLVATGGGWRWDETAVRAHVGGPRSPGCWRPGWEPSRRRRGGSWRRWRVWVDAPSSASSRSPPVSRRPWWNSGWCPPSTTVSWSRSRERRMRCGSATTGSAR